MTEEPKGRTLSKQILQIANIEIDFPYSGGTKFLDRVHVLNHSLPTDDPLLGKTLRMVVYNPDLKSYIRGKQEIIADVQKKSGQYGMDYQIVQAYDDKGEPVYRRKPGGGNFNRRSLEEDLVLESVKRRSIEGQTAIAEAGLLLRAATESEVLFGDEDLERIRTKYLKAVEMALDNYLATESLAKTLASFPHLGRPTEQKPVNAPRTNQDAKSAGSKPDQVSKHSDEEEPPIKHVGDLLTRANKLKVSSAQVAEILGIEKTEDIGDLQDAWKKVKDFAAAKS